MNCRRLSGGCRLGENVGIAKRPFIAAMAFAVLGVAFWAIGSGGGNSLMIAVADEDRGSAARILAARPGLLAQKVMGRTALHLAAAHPGPGILELLLKNGAPLEARDAMGNTPLHVAAHCLRPRAVILLLQAGASPKSRDQEGNTPLHHLAYGGYGDGALELAALMIKNGADPAAHNREGYQAWELAGFSGHKALMDHLKKALPPAAPGTGG